MYSYIKGTVEEINIDHIVIDNNGIGYEVIVPTTMLASLRLKEPDTKIYTYYHVTENGVALYGFEDKEMKSLFKLLIGVNGIGPKGAIAILSTLTVEDLRFAIAGEDSKAIAKAPGIGAKTAQRVIIDLKDKIDFEEAFESKLNVNATGVIANDVKSDVVMALASLGYSSTESLKAMQDISIDENMDVETLLKETLKRLTFL